MAEFDWQVDEDADWIEQARLPVSPPNRGVPHRTVALLLVLLLVGTAAALSVAASVNRRVVEVNQTLEDEVRSVHSLVHRAVLAGDEELFYSLLSGRDLRWTGVQLKLLDAGDYFDRTGFELAASLDQDREGSFNKNVQIALNPELTSAEVTFEIPYSVATPDGGKQQIRLSQTAIYRKGVQRWLLSPPDQRFWGEWLTDEGNLIRVVFPQRDEELARRLAHDLDLLLARMCALNQDEDCLDGQRIELRMTNRNASLLASADLEFRISGGGYIELPTPTLVGLPVDDVGYQALLRGYGLSVVSAAVATAAGYECCQHGVFFLALLDKQLSALDLKPWPLTAEEYESILAREFRWTDLYSPWEDSSLERPVNWQQVYSFIDFMVEFRPQEVSLLDMQRGLRGSHGRYISWSQELLGSDAEVNHLVANWFEFVYEQSSSARSTRLPLPLPEQDLMLLCSTSTGREMALYRFDVSSERRSQALLEKRANGSISLLSDGGLIVFQRFAERSRLDTRTTILRGGAERLLLPHEPDGSMKTSSQLRFAGEDPGGRFVVLASAAAPGIPSSYYLYVPRDCRQSPCSLSPLIGMPLWSPDGQRTLLTATPADNLALAGHGRSPWDEPLYLANRQGQEPSQIAFGAFPFWIDSRSFGFAYGKEVNGTESNRFALWLARPPEPIQHPILESRDLMAAIPLEHRPENLRVAAIETNPADGRQLYLLAQGMKSSRTDQGYLFLIEIASDLSHVQRTELLAASQRLSQPSFDPTGRWLRIHATDEEGSTIRVFNLQAGSRITLGAHGLNASWSADGHWLAQLGSSYIALFAPSRGYHRLIFQDFSYCRLLGWAAANADL